MRIAISDSGKIIQTKIFPTPEDFDEGLKIFKLYSGQKFDKITGGVAVVFNQDKSTSISTSHLHGWVNKPIKQKLSEIFGAEVLLENDTALVALGEASFGAGKGKNIVAYLGLGTGLGGARIVNGKIDQNALGFEPGHQIIVPDGKPCNCGGKGHLETYVTGAYLHRETADWNEAAKFLAIGLTNTIVHWSPDMVVLGGSVMQSISLTQVKTYLKDYLTIFPAPPEIVPAKLGHEAGFYGGLTIIKQHA